MSRKERKARRARRRYAESDLAFALAESCGDETTAAAIKATASAEVLAYDVTHDIDPDGPSETPSASTGSVRQYSASQDGTDVTQLTDTPWIAHAYRDGPAPASSTGI